MPAISKQIKQIALIAGALVVLVVLIAWMAGAFRSKIEPGRVQVSAPVRDEIQTDIVHAIIETEQTPVAGTLRAARRTDISSKLLATIEEISVSAGDRVQAGDVLVRLDDRDLRARLEQARQALNAAEAEFKNARAELERYQRLYQEQVISAQEMDREQKEYEVAQARLEQAREELSAAETMLSYSLLRAPASGVVVDKLAEEGDTASPGQTLMSVYDEGMMRLEAAVPEGLAAGLRLGQELPVELPVLDTTIQGRVEEIVPEAETATRSVLVKIAVPRMEGMVEGMFGRLLVPTHDRTRICAPASAIQEVGQLNFVEVISREGVIERRQVKLSDHREYGRVEVLSGLEAGEEVILHGPPPPPFPTDAITVRRSELP